MKNKMLTKSELLSFGLKSGWVDSVFDAPDEVGPSGHWLNKSGVPLYDLDRVKIACARVGVKVPGITELDIEQWTKKECSTSKPIFSFDFHDLADIVMPGISRDFRSLRISHPVLGREHGSKKRENQLIDASLRAMIKACFQVNLDEGQIDFFLDEISSESEVKLGLSKSMGVVVRPAKRRSYISKPTSLGSIKRFLYAISLIHNKAIRDSFGGVVDVKFLLSTSPLIRFDSTEVRIAGAELPNDVCRVLAKNLTEKRHHLFHGELFDAPGRNESWDEYVIYRDKNVWLLLIEATDFAGSAKGSKLSQSMTTQEIVDWVIERDDEEGQVGSNDDELTPGSRFQRLIEIAKVVAADDCTELLEKWLQRDRSPCIKVNSVVGVVRRPIWIRIYHSVYEVTTNFGPAYLYPPKLDGSAQLVFKSEGSTSMGRIIQIHPELLTILDSYSHELEKLKG